MDLQVIAIIVTVFFVSLGSLLFVTRQLRGGKTFEEAQAEKRLTDKLYGTNKKKNITKKSNAGKKVCSDVFERKLLKEHFQKKTWKRTFPKAFTGLFVILMNIISQNKKEQQKQKSVQQPSAVESDGKTDSGSENDSNASPAANDGKNHVEFTEEEIIAPETNTVQYKVITISSLSINASILGI